MLALTFFFSNVNAQKITLATLEDISTKYVDDFDSATMKLGFDQGGMYAKGKDSAEISYQSHNTNMVDIKTNNAALYKQIKAEITKSGYTPDPLGGMENTENYSRFKKKHYHLSFIDQSSEMNPFKYHISIQYDPR